ncbi:GNAT family N-acetyltransferase [Kribbella sp. NPDC004875]|uniref:GNAT family N-acetyltransferase n=1 Tax=Kribbella sp. NPDC004875 TaxID=3364107 RepID=UPI0036B7960F
MAEVAVPDAGLLARAVRTFQNADADAGYLGAAGTLIFVATVDDEVAGWCWGYRLPRPDGASMLYLHNLAVVESRRGQGIGRWLVTEFISAGRAAGATKMFLTTGAGNVPARKLYDALGGGLATQGATVNYWFML